MAPRWTWRPCRLLLIILEIQCIVGFNPQRMILGGSLPPETNCVAQKPYKFPLGVPLILHSERCRTRLASKRDRRSKTVPDETQYRLRPAKEIVQRILWDPNLEADAFTVGFVDRYQKGFSEVECSAPNTSIKGPSRLFVQALPDHRIAYIKYKRRVVWHKAERIDRMFGSGVPPEDGSASQRIEEVIETYDAWLEAAGACKQQAWSRAEGVLGERKLDEFKELSKRLLSGTVTPKDYAATAVMKTFFGPDGGVQLETQQEDKAAEGAEGQEEGPQDSTSEVEREWRESPLQAVIAAMPEEHSEIRKQVLAALQAGR